MRSLGRTCKAQSMGRRSERDGQGDRQVLDQINRADVFALSTGVRSDGTKKNVELMVERWQMHILLGT